MVFGVQRGEQDSDPPPRCPECNSQRLYKDGIRKNRGEKIQRYICRDCGYRFSDPKASRRKTNVDPYEQCNQSNPEAWASHSGATDVEDYNKSVEPETYRLVCAEEAKNLAATEETRNVVAGDISQLEKELVKFMFYQRNRGNKDSTIERRERYLKELVKQQGANLDDPETVKRAIHEIKWESNRSRNNAVLAYTLYLRMNGKTWEKPHYQETEKIKFVPTEAEIDQLIAASGFKTAAFLQILKETAFRPGEAASLTWDEIDFVRKTITLNHPEKGCKPRMPVVSDKLLGMLLKVRNTSPTKDGNRIFQKRVDHIRRQFERKKHHLSNKLQNTRFDKIMLKTFRTWKATTLYHQTKDPWYVMEFLGHRSLQHTRVYVQLEASLFTAENDEWHCKAAKTPDEAVELVERGFEFVNQIGTAYLYRKRK